MHEVTITIRWRDVDNYGHVNNAVYLNYLEECRDRMVEELFGADEAWDFVLAQVAIDFRQPAHSGRRRGHRALRGGGVRDARASGPGSGSRRPTAPWPPRPRR